VRRQKKNSISKKRRPKKAQKKYNVQGLLRPVKKRTGIKKKNLQEATIEPPWEKTIDGAQELNQNQIKSGKPPHKNRPGNNITQEKAKT